MSDFKSELLACLDELAVALAGHYHQWTLGQREAYESCVTQLTSDCTENYLSDWC